MPPTQGCEPSAIDFIRLISKSVSKTCLDKVPYDTAQALTEFGYIHKQNDTYEKTELGETALVLESLEILTSNVEGQIRNGFTLGAERFKCYLCEQVRQRAYFGPRCQFETYEDQRYKVSMSPCNRCLAHHHATH